MSKKENNKYLHPKKKDNPRLLTKQLSDGRLSLYLEYYLGYTETIDEATKKRIIKHRRQKETLHKYLIPNPKTEAEKEKNKFALAYANESRDLRDKEFTSKKQNMPIENKAKINFLVYCEKFLNEYQNKDVRIVKYCIKHFKDFIIIDNGKDYILPVEITETLAKNFKKHLEKNLNGETPYNYFTKFKKLCTEAIADGYPIDVKILKIRNTRSEGLKKDILDIDEIQRLSEAYCGNDNVKRAFIFSLNTGLRWVDIKALKWCNIDKTKLSITQEKIKHSSTNSMLNLELNENAINVLSNRGNSNESVFILPSHTACLKDLSVWVKKAGIEKHITWHCARHSFAVNLLDTDVVGTDVKTVSGLLGHSSIKHTGKYLHYLDVKGKNAVNKLPVIKMNMI